MSLMLLNLQANEETKERVVRDLIIAISDVSKKHDVPVDVVYNRNHVTLFSDMDNACLNHIANKLLS